MENNNYVQLCVIQGCYLGSTTPEQFEDDMKKSFQCDIKFAEQVKTLPDPNDFEKKTGGRTDLLFYINSKDIPRFAVMRLRFGVRWWEDVIATCNGGGKIYPPEILEKYPKTW